MAKADVAAAPVGVGYHLVRAGVVEHGCGPTGKVVKPAERLGRSREVEDGVVRFGPWAVLVVAPGRGPSEQTFDWMSPEQLDLLGQGTGQGTPYGRVMPVARFAI